MSIYIHRVVFTHRLFCGMLSRTVYPYVRFFMDTFRTLSSFHILQQPSFIHSPSLYQRRCYTCSLSLSFRPKLSLSIYFLHAHTLSHSQSLSILLLLTHILSISCLTFPARACNSVIHHTLPSP